MVYSNVRSRYIYNYNPTTYRVTYKSEYIFLLVIGILTLILGPGLGVLNITKNY